jgi:ABC-type branched-subunit amino acid transport system ATPase component
MNNLILVAEKISKSFGSLQVLKEFSLEIFKPEEGRVLFMGRDITGCEPHRVTRLVVVKTFLVDGKSSVSSRLFR